jgi:hypothetical protein
MIKKESRGASKGEERVMAKKLLGLAALLAAMLVAATPAVAQEDDQYGGAHQYGGQEVTVTGVVENFGTPVEGSSPYGLRDESTGLVYYLAGDFDFGAYEGQRVTATGTTEVVIRSLVLNVSSIEPAGATDDLPETGGPTLVLLVGGALLISSGLLARRVIL